MYKQIIIVFSILTMLVTGTPNIIHGQDDSSVNEITVQINGEKKVLDIQPTMSGETVMLPTRPIFEEFGAVAEWDAEDNKVTVKNVKAETSFEIDSAIKPILKDGNLFLPIEFMSKILSSKIEWNAETRVANIICTTVPQSIYVGIEGFKELGTWKASEGLQGTSSNKVESKPAVANIKITTSGKYRVWVKGRDFATNQPGTRYFNAGINGTMLAQTFGKHGKEGYAWEDGGIVDLQRGFAKFELFDTSQFFARFMGVFISPDLEMTPPNNEEEIRKLTDPTFYEGKVDFPQWAKMTKAPSKEYSIENENVKMNFYEVVGTNGKKVIQRQTYLKDDNKWVAVDNRTDDFGYLLMAADNSDIASFDDNYYPKWDSKVNVGGNIRKYNSSNIYKSTYYEWLIPTTMEKQDNIVWLTASNDYVDLKVKWELVGGMKEPKVTCNMHVKKDGAYSLGAFNSSEVSASNVDFAIIPYRVNGLGVPGEGKLTMEMHASTPVSSITVKEDNTMLPSKKITYGIVVEPSWIPERFLYKSNKDSKFGMTIHGRNGGLQPGVFAPMLGSEESKMKSGQNYEFDYRPTATIGSWYDSYNHIISDIFEIRDYRKNYIASLSDTIFNVRKLMMNDVYSGWDAAVKGFYYMETKNRVSQCNPLFLLQDYLLTEDKDMLVRRTIPTMASILTRNSSGFITGSGQKDEAAITPVGGPMHYDSTVFGGAYWMTRGLVPAFRQIGIDNGIIYPTAGGLSFSDDIWYYKFTGNKLYLDSAKQSADLYLQNYVYKPNPKLLGVGEFVNSNYSPRVSALLDIYEITGDQKYLDGAKEAARIFITTLWVPGIDSGKIDGEVTITSDMIKERDYFDDALKDYFWYGDKRWRLGFPMNEVGPSRDSKVPILDETVPSWVPSRVGLGIEQTMSFRNESLNIMMSNWAPDLLRIATYTGDKTLEIQARNAILGRGANYPGYYYNRNMALQTHVDYPYTGPDFTSIYFTHIPVYISVLEDYMITQMWSWSNCKINFPFVRQEGYAYFRNRQYGFESGNFFDEKDMWLWLKRGIIKPDNIQIDWVAAKKDGKVAFALMNEDTLDITTTVELGKEIPNGANYTGKAIMYNTSGEKSEISIVNGKFTVLVPSHKLVGIIISIPEIKAPDYSKIEFNMQESGSNPAPAYAAVVTHQLGGAYALQMSPDKYFAYVYTEKLPTQVSRAMFYFKTENGKWEKVESTKYPYEAIYQVDDVNKEVEFYIEVYDKNGMLIQKTNKRVVRSVMKK